MADPSKRDWAIAAGVVLVAGAAFLPLAWRTSVRWRPAGGVASFPKGTTAASNKPSVSYGTAPGAQTPAARESLPTDTLKIADVPAPGDEQTPATATASLGQSRLNPRGFPGTQYGSVDLGEPATASLAPGAPGGAAPARPTKDHGRPAASVGRGQAPASTPAAASLSEDPRVAAMAGGLVAQARQIKASPRTIDGTLDLSKPANVRNAVLEQFAIDDRVDASVRQALGRLDSSADIEAQRQATADVLAAEGQPTDEVSITNALARGLAPPTDSPDAPPEPSPQAIDGSINRFAAAYGGPSGAPNAAPGPAGQAGGVPAGGDQPEPGPEYLPPERPPRGVAEAYKAHATAFASALKNFGVAPWDILAIAQQETSFGSNMGHVPLPKGLSKRQADLAAAIKLDAAQQLPAPWQNLRGSETGALGPFQFEPATQLSAGRGNPFDWNNQISYSVPHLLILNGYKPNDPVAQRKAFGRYYGNGNPNGKYALSVAGHAAAIKPLLEPQTDAGVGH